MPLVRVDLIKGRSAGEVRDLALAIHEALVDVMKIPIRDRFQIVTQHEPFEIYAEDAGLGFERDNSVVMIQITSQQGRSASEKQMIFQAIASKLTRVGVTPNNVFISYVENTSSDWSFGFGKAQFAIGELTPYSA
ncbi:MAG: tautomerase family protein [Micrococcales bacterium]|jgi:phenylpyruvate tautomerase PptA (4-oxalocrotonate tautomerase family)|nr:tautomerase family protein [Micrococcales bacterium]